MSHDTHVASGFDWIADQVRAELDRRELSISELARETGVHREQISYWLNGQRFLRSDLLAALLQYLHLTIKPPKR